MEKAKFTDSVLGKTLEKQTKSIQNQITPTENQLKPIEKANKNN